jgi:hypothetical protein
MKRTLALIAALAMTGTAYAWGPKEQGILTGVAGLWIAQQLHNRPHYQYQPPVVVHQAPPVVVYQQPQMVIGPSPYCPPGTGYFGHDWRTFTDQWGRYYTQQVPICR